MLLRSVLLRPWIIGKLSAVPFCSSVDESMISYASRVHPEMTQFLRQTLVNSKKCQETTLWDYIMSYTKKNFYMEKSVLFDPKLAVEIVDYVEKNASGKSLFIDLTGGIGLVSTETFRRGIFANVIAAEDKIHAATERLSSSLSSPLFVVKKNLLHDRHLFSYIRKELRPEEDRFWKREEPFASFYGIVSHACIKRFVYSAMNYHVSINNDDLVTNLFHFGRPEFFFVVSQRTLTHLDVPPGQLMYRRSSNVLFQLLFDYRVLTNLSRKGFLPWKNLFTKRTPTYYKKFPELESNFFLVYCRPKRKLAGLEDPDMIKYFPFFLNMLLSKRVTPVFDRLDEFVPEISRQLRERSIVESNKRTGYLDNDEIMTLFHLVTRHPDFHGSTLKAAAQNYGDELRDFSFSFQSAVDDLYDSHRKQLQTLGTLQWDERKM